MKPKTVENFEKHLIDQFMKLIRRADLDKIITGNSYWEFTERKIELIDPQKIKHNKKGVIICPRRLTKHRRELKGRPPIDELTK